MLGLKLNHVSKRATGVFVQQFLLANIKERSKLRFTGALFGESTGD